MTIAFVVNGRPVVLETDPLRRLIDVLREDLGLTGVKEGCGEGECGACSVLIDERPALACIVAVGAVEGRHVVTIEGYQERDLFRKVASAFSETGALQCGFCTPGMIIAAGALIDACPDPDEETIREALSGNLCRCTGYNRIVQAVMRASRETKEPSSP